MFEPSDYQKRIFEWFQKPDGPIAINAVAGSGKTTSLVMGFQQLRSPGTQLFAAFNTSIVAELKKRLPSTVNCQTIHSLGYATLRKAFPDAKWDLENGNVKYRQMARDIEVDRNQFSDPKAIQDCVLSFLNYAQLTLTPLEVEPLMAMADRFGIDIPSGVTVEKVASTVKSMLEIGLEQGRKGLISFSDMLWMPATLGLNPPKYSLVAVDEAQDMNRAQMALVMRAMDTGGNFVSVGDPRQAIYMFAGAEADSFDQIKNYFGAKELPLTFCYRCPESVILEAQKIVPQIECPPGTKAGIVDTITEEQFDKMLAPGDMVVCCLTAPLVKLCFDLIKRRIPAKVKGRDIGATIGNVVKQIMKRQMDMSQFPKLMYAWQENQLGMLREKLGSEDQQESVNDRVAVLEICYAMFSPNSPNGFVEDIKSLFNDDQSPITLCTVHRAKGLENDRVFIIRPDKLPLVRKNQTQAQFDQEMNLKYVAITRAKNELYYVTPDPSTAEDNNRYRNPGIPGLTL